MRAAIIGIVLAVLGICWLLLPAIHREWQLEYPEIGYLKYPVLIVLSTTAIAFFGAAYQAFKLLDYIDNDTAFSQRSVRALKNIKYCAFIVGGLYTAGLPLTYYITEREDAPGLMVIGLVFAAAPITIAVFAGVAQKLFQNAIAIKSENDLTV